MKIKKLSDILKESLINIKTLDKSKSGKLRGDVLVDKIKDHEKLSFSDGKSDIVINDKEIIPNITNSSGEYDATKASKFLMNGSRYKDVIETDKDDYKLNQIVKTVEFGSGAGSSLGAVNTRKIESLQCLFLSFRQLMGVSLTISNIPTDLSQYLDKIRVAIDIDDDLIDSFDSWVNTFIKTANALFEKNTIISKDSRVDNILSHKKIYIFYQISYTSGANYTLYQKYRSFKETKGIPIPKWTPSDIWAVSEIREQEIIQDINACNTLSELCDLVDRLFDAKDLIGISLKKVSKDITLIVNKETTAPIYEFKGISLSDNIESNKGIGVVVRCHSDIYQEGLEKMTIRSFSDDLIDVSGEVNGKSAQFGKVGLSFINKIIKSVGVTETVPTKIQLKNVSDADLLKDIIEMDANLKVIYGKSKLNNKRKDFDRPRLVSKYQGLYLGTILDKNKSVVNNNGEILSDIIVQKMFYHAMSIKNEIFECPKYVRVI
jgi:hypothetical protein